MAAQTKGRAFFQSEGGVRIDIDYGQVSFVTTGLTVQAPTSLGVIQAGFASNVDYSTAAAGGNVLKVDRVLATEPYTAPLVRRASGGSANSSYYMFMGNHDGTSDAPRFATLQVRGGPEIQLQWGNYDFSGTNLSVDVPTRLSNVLCAVATMDSHTDAAATSKNVLACDRTVASGIVAVKRTVSGGSGDGFNYLFVGGNMSSWPQIDALGQAVVVELESYGGEVTYVQFGHDNFTTTGTTKEVSTPLNSIQAVIALSEIAVDTGNGEDVMFSDGTLSSDAVTISRKVGTGSDNGFSYVLIGQK